MIIIGVFKMNKMFILVITVFTIFTGYSQKKNEGAIELSILKDTITNNSLITVEFYNNSDTAYYFPIDTSIDRFIWNNSFLKHGEKTLTMGKFSIKENFLDKNLQSCEMVTMELIHCFTKQTNISNAILKDEINSVNIDFVFLAPKAYARLTVPVQFVKNYFHICDIHTLNNISSLEYLQYTYKVIEDDVNNLKMMVKGKQLESYYNDLNWEGLTYKLYIGEIKSNIVPIKWERSKELLNGDYDAVLKEKYK
ncbi:hypothetical protein [Myroides profundi]|uniref:Uncharacterized protein n=1 Tax=Myroides profundi TaxID=480520 RepID=A0AAJ4W6W3_MYRPR|nr:hypothetical protein [Myroides profundi]AJH14474.1 hypothetical protein MPR_1292 [Myroides profundi]SER58236.1 hypothetical protein SAMN04488089_12018 [Myroides profundi]